MRREKHALGDDGACVMELASMLDGDTFTDHPRSVSPVIAAILREYNDRIAEHRRKDLYAYAARAVGTSASHEVERERARRSLEWQREERRRASPLIRWMFPSPRRHERLRSARFPQIGRAAVHVVQRSKDDSHQRLLKLVDELIEIGRETSEAGAAPAARPRPAASAATPAPGPDRAPGWPRRRAARSARA